MSETGHLPSLAVVVPVFNEEFGIENSCKEILAAVKRYPGRAEVVAVDDGSRDASVSVIKQLESQENLLSLVEHGVNQGYGGALRTGTRWANQNGFEYVAYIDSDLTNPPKDLLKIGALAGEGALYIKGSRFIRRASMRGVPWRRRVYTVIGNLVGSLLFGIGIRDVTNGFRAAKVELAAGWHLTERGFAIIMEELYLVASQKIPVAVFPTELRSRTTDQRPTSFTYSLPTILSYLKYPVMRFSDRVVSGIKR